MPTWLPWILSAVLIGGSLVWIALADDKGMAIFGGVVAVGVSRVLLGDIARWQVESENAKRRAAEQPEIDEED